MMGNKRIGILLLTCFCLVQALWVTAQQQPPAHAASNSGTNTSQFGLPTSANAMRSIKVNLRARF